MKETLMKGIGLIKYILLILLIAFIVSLMRGDKISSSKLEDVTAKVIEAMDMTDLSVADNRTVRRLYGLNVDDYDGVLFLEKKGASYTKLIKKEKALVADRNVKVLGAIVL